jgi:phage tail sheath protein FI
MPTFLHGSETKEVDVAGRPFSVVLSSVVGLIGVAPIGPVNTLTLITTPQDAANTFGAEVPGFSIPETLAAHFAAGGGVVLVINVFDSAANTVAVANELATIANGKAKLAAAPLSDLVVKNEAGTTTLVLGVDYSVNAYGVITVVNRLTAGGYPDGVKLQVSYTKFDASTVTPSQLVGDIDAVTNERTGSYLFELSRSNYGFDPQILVAPSYSATASVAARLEVLADKYSACFLLDAPFGATQSAVIAGRRPSAPLGGFGTTSERAGLCFPYMERPDPATPPTPDNLEPKKLVPFSAILCGVMSGTDLSLGYWFSASNKAMPGVTGAEVKLSAAINDPTTDVQLLNAAGIITYFAGYGTGYRTFGNRSASFPTSTSIKSFLSVRRTCDVIERTIELNMLPYLDLPLNLATIDAVKGGVAGFGSSLVQRGATIDFTIDFLPEKNPVAQLATGNPVFTYVICPPPAMERIGFEALVDISLLRKLVTAQG